MKKSSAVLLMMILCFPFVVGAKECYVGENTWKVQTYNTIQGALSHYCQDVLVKGGRYRENIVIPNGVSVEGVEKPVVIEGSVEMNDLSQLRGVEINNLKKMSLGQVITGLKINSGAKVVVKDVRVTYSDIGIEVMDGGKLILANSEIFKNRKGIYVRQKGEVVVGNNKIIDNLEEGVDVRAQVVGVISENEIINNGESGIEVIVGGTNLKITENVIKKNRASGITLQFYKDTPDLGNFLIGGNKFIENDNYAISCQRPGGGRTIKNYWDQSVVFEYNEAVNNREGEINSSCKFNASKRWEMYRTKKAQKVLNKTLREVKEFYGGMSEKEIASVINGRMKNDNDLSQPDGWWKQIIEDKEKETADGIVQDLENKYKELQDKNERELKKVSQIKIIIFGADPQTKQKLKDNLEECFSFVRKTQRRIGRMGVGYIKTDTLKRIKKFEQCHKLQVAYERYGENQGLIFSVRRLFQK